MQAALEAAIAEDASTEWEDEDDEDEDYEEDSDEDDSDSDPYDEDSDTAEEGVYPDGLPLDPLLPLLFISREFLHAARMKLYRR